LLVVKDVIDAQVDAASNSVTLMTKTETLEEKVVKAALKSEFKVTSFAKRKVGL